MPHIAISGLRRSGTTILWEMLRESSDRTAAYDEPFHPDLVTGIRENKKRTWSELATVLSPVGGINPVSISPSQELNLSSYDIHAEYLRSLFSTEKQVVIDFVRCWNHIPEILPGNDVFVVQIVREPRAWVSAHLDPTAMFTWRGKVARIYRRITMFKRTKNFNNYHYEQIISEAINSSHEMWRYIDLNPHDLRRQPAFVRLLAFWWCANLTLFRKLSLGDSAWKLVTLNDFCSNPLCTLKALENSVEWMPGDYDAARVRKVLNIKSADDDRWLSACDLLGIPSTLMKGNFENCSVMEVFSGAIRAQSPSLKGG